MSDPMTNVEIEDVLSSIRRLVSDGEKARTQDSVPSPDEEDSDAQREDQGVGSAEPQTDRLILTPAFLVAVDDEPVEKDRNDSEEIEDRAAPLTLTNAISTPSNESALEEDAPDEGASAEEWPEIDAAQSDVALNQSDEPQEWRDDTAAWDEGSHEDADEGTLDEALDAEQHHRDDVQTEAEDQEGPTPSPAVPDRSELVATIAELEAAMNADTNDYEPEGNEPMADEMGNTIAWPGSRFRHTEVDVEDAEISDRETPPEGGASGDQIAFDSAAEHQGALGGPDSEVDGTPLTPRVDAPADDTDEYDDDLDGLLDAEGRAIDEQALRALVADVVREELMGPLGERITRNVRKMVRREIYRVLSSQEFD